MYTTKEASELTGLSAQTLRKYYKQGKINVTERAGKFFYEAESLKPYILLKASQEKQDRPEDMKANHIVEMAHATQAPTVYSPAIQSPENTMVFQFVRDSFKDLTQRHEEGRKQERELYEQTFQPIVNTVLSTSTQHYYNELAGLIGHMLENVLTLFQEMENSPTPKEQGPTHESYQYFMHRLFTGMDLPEELKAILLSRQIEDQFLQNK